MGTMLSLTSAAFYAMHTLRLSAYCDVDATTQAAGQVLINAALDVLALPIAWGMGSGLHHYFRKATAADVWNLAIGALWNGLLVVGATTWAMSYAQQAFEATTAALAYATEPLFAALFAAAILHDHLGAMQLGGGALVILANVLAAIGARTVTTTVARCCRRG